MRGRGGFIWELREASKSSEVTLRGVLTELVS